MDEIGDDWPRDLRRCTCATRSYDPEDHANGCNLGTRPSISSARAGRRPTLSGGAPLRW
ncbi:hypothetical protein [Mycobacterium marinum]|uniref:hypothetical protein n=1 Tax=Mycobacterium marinum TaxID=1781 RepID=UPI002358C06E|nr:hypothetical protein [Mycobacterium marinum]MDC9006469.1 hypothetical protein [Mycobacterium marinum]